MAATHVFLSIIALIIHGNVLSSAADWNIMHHTNKPSSGKLHSQLQIKLKNFCESWRMNVELHFIQDFDVVPDECVDYIAKYMISTQYKVDSERTVDECIVYLSTAFSLKKDGRDAWIFDIDDTLLSTIPYLKKTGLG